jgi:hypothetical protein
LHVHYNGEPVPSSPLRVPVAAHLDVSNIRITDAFSCMQCLRCEQVYTLVLTAAFVNSTYAFTVDTRSLSHLGGGDRLTASVRAPNASASKPCRVVDNMNGMYTVELLPVVYGACMAIIGT